MMVNYNMLCYSFCALLLAIAVTGMSPLWAQGNCLIYPEGSGERKACELCYEAGSTYRQGSAEKQLYLDSAIRVGPKYAWAYYQKSIAFFKRGLLADGLKLINRAIELEPENYLYYRAYWYFQHQSYEYCIKDLEDLYTTHNMSYMTTPGGSLEMRILLAMSYAQSGDPEKGIHWVKHLMEFYQKEPNLKGVFDHHVLGILYYENQQWDLAEAEFQKQLIMEDQFADTYYYLGLIEEQRSMYASATGYFKQSHERMQGLHGGYSRNSFQRFNVDIEDVQLKL